MLYAVGNHCGFTVATLWWSRIHELPEELKELAVEIIEVKEELGTLCVPGCAFMACRGIPDG